MLTSCMNCFYDSANPPTNLVRGLANPSKFKSAFVHTALSFVTGVTD